MLRSQENIELHEQGIVGWLEKGGEKGEEGNREAIDPARLLL